MAFSIFCANENRYKFIFPSIMTSKTEYLEKRIRDGFTTEDVRLWQGLCRAVELELAESTTHMYAILDLAKHNGCGPLDMVKTGRMLSNEKAINEKFMAALFLSVVSDNEGDDEAAEEEQDEPKVKMIDLTAEESLSGSYEEECGDARTRLEPSQMYNEFPTSAEAYEIDGFVVPDHESVPASEESPPRAASSTSLPHPARTPGAPKPKNHEVLKKRALKRRLVFDEEAQVADEDF